MTVWAAVHHEQSAALPNTVGDGANDAYVLLHIHAQSTASTVLLGVRIVLPTTPTV